MEEFSLFDFCKKRKSNFELFGVNIKDSDGNDISLFDQAAIITHYLQLKDNNIEISYESEALMILKVWGEYAKKNNICIK